MSGIVSEASDFRVCFCGEKVKGSCSVLSQVFATPWTGAHQAPLRIPMEFSRQEYWSGLLFLLQGIFPTQELNPGLLHCRRILYQLSHQGSPRILEWVADPFSRGSSWPRNRIGVSCIAGGFFTNWAMKRRPVYRGPCQVSPRHQHHHHP